MRTRKSIVAAILVVAMMIGIMPTKVLAANEKTYNLQAGKEFIFTREAEEQVDYFKFKATANGYITVDIDSDEISLVDFYLCNAKKKVISEYTRVGLYYGDDRTDNVPTFGVKKNTIYYIRLEGADPGEYNIKYKLTPTKEKAGTKQKKAVNVKQNKLIKGSVYCGKTNSDWYKIKINKKCKVRFVVTSDGTGRFRGVDLLTSKGIYKRNLAKERENVYQLYGYSKYTKTITLKKGTYYIRAINDLSGSTSFQYTFKWSIKK